MNTGSKIVSTLTGTPFEFGTVTGLLMGPNHPRVDTALSEIATAHNPAVTEWDAQANRWVIPINSGRDLPPLDVIVISESWISYEARQGGPAEVVLLSRAERAPLMFDASYNRVPVLRMSYTEKPSWEAYLVRKMLPVALQMLTVTLGPFQGWTGAPVAARPPSQSRSSTSY